MGKEHDLIEAAKAGNVAQIEKLLQVKRTGLASTLSSFRFKSVNPNCQDETGSTPLHHAALNGHREAVHVLLDYNASNHIPDNTGSYPLHLAAWKGDLDIARLLIHRGPSKASVNEQVY
jgi:ankyrin repeat protein